MSKKSPLQIVKDQFGSKKELAAKLAEVLEPDEDESKEELSARLELVANAKLLHLHALADKVSAHGGREGLTAKIVEAEGLSKDKDYSASLAKRSLGWLVDRVESLAKKAKKAG